MFKKIFRSVFFTEIMVHIIVFYMRLVRLTTRWEIIGKEHYDNALGSQNGAVCLYWHSRILLLYSMWPSNKKQRNTMSSLSKDGQIGARIGEVFGCEVVRGSSAKIVDGQMQMKGSIQAFRKMVGLMRSGNVALMSPDGPSGPRMRVQEGAIRIAAASGVAIIPMTASIKGARFLNTWDRALLPPLFSKGIIIYGEPISAIDAKADPQKTRQIAEDRLNELTHKVDELMGGPKILPDEIIE
jgi:lysophospholipid acyltransferase (LPLAT)-like uncharacterized protein